MIAEEYSNISPHTPSLTDKEGTFIAEIYKCLKKACNPFIRAKNQSNLHLPLNENKLTQIYIEQVEVFVKPIPGIAVKNQYSDTFFGTRGVPDFYFHIVEEGVHHLPLIVFESKILTSTLSQTKRKREYVIGDNNNGGIERFKSEKHGKGLFECGLIGFIEDNDFVYWRKNINTWITDLSQHPESIWMSDEVLFENESTTNYCVLESIAHRESDDIKLTHVWILVNNI